MASAHFSPALFGFLAELAANNERGWFEANRARYRAELRDPMLRFIEDFAPRLAAISPHFVADPRPNGGSLFRVHRDVRFARDKRPYKTNAGAHFRHAAARDAHAPGFYLHLEPGTVFAGGGRFSDSPPSAASGPSAARLRRRPPAHRRPEAQGLHRDRPAGRGGRLRGRLHRPFRRDLPRLRAAGAVPHRGAGPGVLRPPATVSRIASSAAPPRDDSVQYRPSRRWWLPFAGSPGANGPRIHDPGPVVP